MLEQLHVRDLALIEEAWLEFGAGMTVFTGETGAGKTVLLGALKLLVGERADSASVRSGATEALVEGVFRTSDGELLARRRVTSDGRSRCTIDGEMATVGTLGERVGPLVDLHGQHEHQALLASSSHVGYLDRWMTGGHGALVEAYRTALDEYRDARAAEATLIAEIEGFQADVERHRFVRDEIESVGPRPDEDEELETRLRMLAHGERLAQVAAEATELVRGEAGAMDRAAQAAAALERVAGIDPALDVLARELASAAALLDDSGTALRSYRDSIEYDPAAIDEIQSRLSALNGLKRRYGPSLDEVLASAERAALALQAASGGDEALEAACERTGVARIALETAGRLLDDSRRAAAPGFAAAIGEAMADLAMLGARFEVDVRAVPFDEWSGAGPHRIEFLYAPASGSPARSLSRIASGGELSRMMLALKGVLGRADRVETLVFDEVDAGIGGATATAVGKRLADLARTHQVIVVTHLAQVAAFADAHLVVRKDVDGGRATTSVTPVEGEARVAEIARMLSGSSSETGRAHAYELLELAAAARTTGVGAQ
jgi:DNA repair protein RecN (Recombination protein N)